MHGGIVMHGGCGGKAINDVTLWGWWYGLLVTLPLFVAGVLVKEWMARAVPQRVRMHGRQLS